MSKDFHIVFYDAAQDIFRIPQAALADLDGNSVNVSNDNAAAILAALGIDGSLGVKPLEEFAEIVAAARQADLKSRKGRRSPAVPATVDEQPGLVTMIDCGRRAGYVERRLGQLSALVEKGREFGATHISWGKSATVPGFAAAQPFRLHGLQPATAHAPSPPAQPGPSKAGQGRSPAMVPAYTPCSCIPDCGNSPGNRNDEGRRRWN